MDAYALELGKAQGSRAAAPRGRRRLDLVDTTEEEVRARGGARDPTIGDSREADEHGVARGSEIEGNTRTLHGLGVDRAADHLLVLSGETNVVLRPEAAH